MGGEVRGRAGGKPELCVLGPGKELGFLSTCDSGHGRVENWDKGI